MAAPVSEPADILSAVRAGFAGAQADALDGEVAARARLWRAGRIVAQAESCGSDGLQAAQSAGADLRAALADESDQPGDALFVEVEAERSTRTPEGLIGLLQTPLPGRHGLLLRDGERTARGWPIDALRTDGRTAAWVKALNREVRPPGARLASSTTVEVFTTVEAVGTVAPTDGERISPRAGGFRLVDRDEVLPDRLTGSALQAAAWLLRHQRPDGSFAYEYAPPSADNEGGWTWFDQLVRQCGCAWGIATVARLTRDRKIAEAAARAVGGILDRHLRRDGPGRLFYLEDMYGEAKLGAPPLLLLAVCELGASLRIPRETVDQLTASLLAVQSQDGRLGTRARGLELEGSETYYAGQIVLALARLHAIRKRPRLRTAVERSLAHYRARWGDEAERDLSFTTWMIQACDQWHALTNEEQTRDYAYAMADWALEEQHGEDCENLLWVGAFQNTPGIGTAAYSEGIVSALAIAQREGDQERVERYRESLILSMRFLLQLSLDGPEHTLVGGPEHIGGVRSALHRSGLRCDNAQHYLMSMLRARALCWPDE
ncbi:MAG: hypothetical protein F4066_11615 [Chloroflexi bacterium]|nr:hypothetical protein [Chloroflexota bacterium]MYF81121.1 hypothetical protein [Chloroflexota bacterium]MYI05487.1 hypothetical protein [Chloroflexota bacterium]